MLFSFIQHGSNVFVGTAASEIDRATVFSLHGSALLPHLPLAILVVTFVYLFRIPSDLQFGKFDLLHQNSGNLMANLLLIQMSPCRRRIPVHFGACLWKFKCIWFCRPFFFCVRRNRRGA